MTHDISSYHATAALEEAQKLARQKIPSAAALQLHSFSFDDFGLENDEMLQVSFSYEILIHSKLEQCKQC